MEALPRSDPGITGDRIAIMSYAIIGFGKIGHALAKAFVRKGIRSARLRTSSVSRRSNWAAFPKADCLCRRAEIVGAG